MVIDDFLDPGDAQAISNAFPAYRDMQWFYGKEKYPLEPDKAVIDSYDRAPEPIKNLLDYLGSEQMISFLTQMSGISELFLDTSFHGGFLQQAPRGGKLGLHLDRQTHREHSDWKRELTLLIYFNQGWEECWNGDLQFWAGVQENGYTVSNLATRIFPVFNRLVVFRNTDEAIHGYPDPIMCPEGTTRKVISVYYYRKVVTEDSGGRTGGKYFLRPYDPVSPEILAHIDARTHGYALV